MNERYNEQDPAPQYDPEAARIRRALRAQKARRRKKMRSRRLFLLGMALILLFVLVPNLWDRAERLLYPRKYEALVEQWADTYDLDPLLVDAFIRTESINIAFNKLRFFGVERGNGVKTAVNNAVNACSVRLNGELGCTADKLHSLFGGIYKIQIVFNELVAVRILGIVFGVEHAVEQAAGIFEQNGAFAAAHR